MKQTDKQRKAHGELVTLPKCASCGEHAVAENVGVCLRCGKKSLEGRILELEVTVRELTQRVREMEPQVRQSASQTMRIGSSR